jgi:hypothetical protein
MEHSLLLILQLEVRDELLDELDQVFVTQTLCVVLVLHVQPDDFSDLLSLPFKKRYYQENVYIIGRDEGVMMRESHDYVE